jgi:hypothetical protein
LDVTIKFGRVVLKLIDDVKCQLVMVR